MKTIIRNKAFETNSSSTHSICIEEENENAIEDGFITNANQKLNVAEGQFGWESDSFSSFPDKLDYLYMYLNYTEGSPNRSEITANGESLVKWLVSEFNKRGLSIEIRKYEVNEDKWFDQEGYIDHQSIPNDELEEVIQSQKAILNFLFNCRCSVITDNDNH